MTLLHFTQISGEGEYVVITQASDDANDFKRHGYKLSGVFNLHETPRGSFCTLPIDSSLERTD